MHTTTVGSHALGGTKKPPPAANGRCPKRSVHAPRIVVPKVKFSRSQHLRGPRWTRARRNRGSLTGTRRQKRLRQKKGCQKTVAAVDPPRSKVRAVPLPEGACGRMEARKRSSRRRQLVRRRASHQAGGLSRLSGSSARATSRPASRSRRGAGPGPPGWRR